MRSYKWGPDLIGPVSLYEKEETPDAGAQRKGHVRTQREDSYLQAKERVLTRK